MNDDEFWNGPSATTGILGDIGSQASGAPPPYNGSSVNLGPWNPGGFGDLALDPSAWDSTGLSGSAIASILPQRRDASAAFPPSPGSGSPVDLAAWNDTGLGDGTLPILLPQQDTSAALLPSSALAPSQPLYDPTPFTPPEMTMDQAAMASGMSPEQVAAIRNGAERQVEAQTVASDTLGPLAEWALPEIGVPLALARTVSLGIDALNNVAAIQGPQRMPNAGDQAIFKRLNDSEIQSIPSTAKVWLP